MVTVLGVLGILYHSKNTNERKKTNELVANQEHSRDCSEAIFPQPLDCLSLQEKKKKKKLE